MKRKKILAFEWVKYNINIQLTRLSAEQEAMPSCPSVNNLVASRAKGQRIFLKRVN